MVSICREDPERRDLPIVTELATLSTEIMKILIGNLNNRRMQDKWAKLEEYFEMLQDIGAEERYQAEFMLKDL